jgi:hypothetical protein
LFAWIIVFIYLQQESIAFKGGETRKRYEVGIASIDIFGKKR